jgi:hypothetical protein
LYDTPFTTFSPPQQDNGNNDRQEPQQPEPPQPPPQQAPIPVGNQQQQGMDPALLALLQQMNQNNNRQQVAPLAPAESNEAILARARREAEEKAKDLRQGFMPFYGQQQYAGPMTGGGPLLGSSIGSRPFNSRMGRTQVSRKGAAPAFNGTGKVNFRQAPVSSGEGVRGGLGKFN